MAENYVPVSDEDRRWAASTPEGGLVFRGTFAPAPSFLNDPCGEAIECPTTRCGRYSALLMLRATALTPSVRNRPVRPNPAVGGLEH